jgi:hypothetical protein
MDSRDHSPDTAARVVCGACDRPIPPAQARILAHRDDLVFADLRCDACGSVSLAMFAGEAIEWLRAEAAPAGSPIRPDDVLDMHLLLAGWSGDLRSLVDSVDGSGGAPSRA